jgi:signal transduction histidine kinase
MKKTKKGIKKTIFLSQVSVVTIALIMTAIAFNICLNIYIKSQAKAQLAASGALLQKYIATDLSNVTLEQQLLKEDKEVIKTLQKIDKNFRQSQNILTINYAIISKEKNQVNLLYSNEDTNALRQDILPILKREKWTPSDAKKSRLFYFTASNKNYTSIFYPVKIQNNKNAGYLFLYSDIAQSNELVVTVNIILAFILILAASIAFIISNLLAKKISTPISELSKLANQIGNRDYSCNQVKYTNDEIGELGKTMNAMADKLSSYDSTMKTFLQNASHELRTPLMSIQGYAEGIKYGVVDNQDKAVEIIIGESKRLTTIVEDLLYLSKIDAMQEKLKIEAVNGENLLRSCIERVSGIALNSSVQINLHMSDEEVLLNVDEEMFSRAIINILGNSLRYAKRSIDITLSKLGGISVIQIVDDGAGFDEEDVDKIFDRFYKGKGGKYGLGLAITKTIVEKHNGSITAGNNPQEGAYFKIILS